MNDPYQGESSRSSPGTSLGAIVPAEALRKFAETTPTQTSTIAEEAAPEKSPIGDESDDAPSLESYLAKVRKQTGEKSANIAFGKGGYYVHVPEDFTPPADWTKRDDPAAAKQRRATYRTPELSRIQEAMERELPDGLESLTRPQLLGRMKKAGLKPTSKTTKAQAIAALRAHEQHGDPYATRSLASLVAEARRRGLPATRDRAKLIEAIRDADAREASPDVDREFTIRNVTRELQQEADDLPMSVLDEIEATVAAMNTDDTAFHNDGFAVPPDMIEGYSAQDRAKIAARVPINEDAQDIVDFVGERKVQQAIDEILEGKRGRLDTLTERLLKDEGAHPRMRLMALIRSKWPDLSPEQRRQQREVVDANAQPEGEMLTIFGEPFEVVERDGRKVLVGETMELDAEAVGRVPVDPAVEPSADAPTEPGTMFAAQKKDQPNAKRQTPQQPRGLESGRLQEDQSSQARPEREADAQREGRQDDSRATQSAREEVERRLKQPLSAENIRKRFPLARVTESPIRTSWRVEHANGVRVDYRLDTSGKLKRAAIINDREFAESLTEDFGGESLTLDDGRTIEIPRSVDALRKHPDAAEIVTRFSPGAAYAPGLGRVLVDPDHANMETFEHEMFHAAYDLALTPDERAQLDDAFGNEEGAYHSGLKVGVSHPVLDRIRSGEVWARQKQADSAGESGDATRS